MPYLFNPFTQNLEYVITDTTGITQLTSDVTAGPGSGSQAATVASVGGSAAANVHSAELAANAASSTDTTGNTIVKRNSGNFSAGTITATLSGNASTVTTNANLTGPITSVGNATTIANLAVTNAMIVASTIDLTAKVTGILPIANGGTAVSSVTTSPIASSFAGWDANKNLSTNAILHGYTTTVTSGGTTTLTVSSTELQFFTSASAQTVVLPVASTLTLGQRFTIVNLTSGGNIVVQSSGGNTVGVQTPRQAATTLTCILTSGTTAASWSSSTIPFTPLNIATVGSGNGNFGMTITNDGTNTLKLAVADASNYGVVSTTTQTFAGTKTFSSNPTLSAMGTGIVHSSSGGALTSSLLVNADITNSTIDLTAKVTGILPIANGGTGNTSGTNGAISSRYYASSTSLSGTLATINWTTQDWIDTGITYSSGTFTVTNAGKYQVDASLLFSGTIALNDTAVMEIQKNGTVVSRRTKYLLAGMTDGDIQIGDKVKCAANDTIQIQVKCSSATPAIVSSNFDNYCSIAFLGT